MRFGVDGSLIPLPQLQFTSLITQVVDDVLQRRRQTQTEPVDEADVSVIWNKVKNEKENTYGGSFGENQK